MLRLDLTEVSLKVRTGGPNDDPEDQDLPYWAGVLPLFTAAGEPERAVDLLDGIELPAHVDGWARPTAS